MSKIVIVDDDFFSLYFINSILEKEYEVVVFNRGNKLLEYLENDRADLILLDYYMPEKDGIEVLAELKTNPDTAAIPVVILTGEQDSKVEASCFEKGAEDFINKPLVPEIVRWRISRILELYKLRKTLETQLDKKTRQVENVMLQAIATVANTVDAKDEFAIDHSTSVASYAAQLAKELGWSDERFYTIYHIGLLHDIGKLTVPDVIIHKQSELSMNEWKVIKDHTTIGGEILKDVRIVNRAEEGALYHHERYDGTGYPKGLKGNEIPVEARIISLADAYDAMTSNRAYRDRLTREQVLQEFIDGKGTQFDPEMTEVFLKMIKEERLDKFFAPIAPKGMVLGDTDNPAEASNQLLFRVMEANNRAVKNEAMRDFLTGIHNRSYAEKYISKFLQKNSRGTYFMLDLDNFKQVNDRFGHLEGDNALRFTADMITKVVKDSGIACRMGGDEFAIFIYEDKNKEELQELANQMLVEYDKIKQKEDIMADTSVSIGIAIAPEDENTYQGLYEAADKALYYSKRAGKNRYTFYKDAMSQEPSDREAVIDVKKLQEFLEIDNTAGTYQVRYSDFPKVYKFIARTLERTNQTAQLLLLSLQCSDEELFAKDILQGEIKKLEAAVGKSLRRNDVSTRYSNSQVLVVLMDISDENMEIVIRRIINRYKDASSYEEYDVTYEKVSVDGSGSEHELEEA